MKIAILSYDFAEYCIQQANGLVRDSDVLLLLPRCEAEEYEHLLDPAVRYCPFDKPRLRHATRQLVVATDLVRQIRRFGPDVVHFQHGHLWFNLLLRFLRDVPMVVTVHDPRHHLGDRVSRKTPQPIMDLGVRRADRVIVHGELLKEQVHDLHGIPIDRIHVVPHVAIGQQDAGSDAAVEGNSILFFGRIWRYKGLEYLIQAEPMITDTFPDARIVIAGEGENLAPYRRQMVHPERFDIHNRHISAAERDELFRGASVVVLPYIEATQSGVIPVAYSYSKPVIATRVGALAEAVDDGETGLLVPPRDPAALAGAVVELLSDPARCRAMGAAGRRKLDAECSPPVVARQTMAVYRRAILDRASVRQAIQPDVQPEISPVSSGSNA